MKNAFTSPLLFLALICATQLTAAPGPGLEIWDLARQRTDIHRYSTLFTAYDSKNHLSRDEGIDRAIGWCKETGVTKVYLESFRDGLHADREVLEHARDRFLKAGFLVSGCVTTTDVGKQSNRWNLIPCYTDTATQSRLQNIFEFAAGLFDEIMIDDFWFTDCMCAQCDAARLAKKVTVADHEYPVSGDTWEDYRCELMVRLSRDRVIGAAKRINPKVKLIIKYPQWYDDFHNRGYEVVRETADFDRMWVGTESRDYLDPGWGGTVQYESYFIMRWLAGIGGAKCGGGWYDWFGTTERTYVEQARQTVLGGAKESMLFCYGGLQGTTGPKDVERLRPLIPDLINVSKEVQRREIVGIAAYKPPNSHPEGESRIYDFVGMLGLPLAPCHEFPTNAPAAFFPVHALKDPDFAAKFSAFVKTGKPVLLTDGLVRQLGDKVNYNATNVSIIAFGGNPKSLLGLQQVKIDKLRTPLLRALNTTFSAPNQVGLYLFTDHSWVIENFNDEAVTVEFNGETKKIEARDWILHWN